MSSGKLEFISIDKVTLDTNNPRIKKYLEKKKKITPEDMYLALGQGSYDTESGSTTSFMSLKESIRTNRGIINPIIVDEASSGEYVVIEGNTRVAIYREFKENKIPGDWGRIPALVKVNLSESEKNSIRLQAHLVGPRQWDPYSKAKYLCELRDEHSLTWEQVVNYCGGKKRELENYVAAYRDMEKYYRAVISDDGEFDTTRFSAFVELQKSGTKEAIVSNGYTLEDFADWVNKRLIDPLNTVRKLPLFLQDEACKQTFLKHGAREAEKLLHSPKGAGDLQDAPVKLLMEILLEKIRNLRWEEMKLLRENPTGESTQLYLDLGDEINDIRSQFIEE